jgi:hypothetical protein
MAAALFGMLLAAPIVVLGLPFWAVAVLTHTIARLLEPQFVPWQELITFDQAIGWKSKANLDAYGIADDVFHLTTDSQGWRGQTSLAESDVVVFGDSYAFGYGVDDKALFSEINPHVRIKAIGAPGYNMVQELLLMRQLSSQLRDKLVVWFFYLGNDLYENLMPDMKGYRTPFVRQVNGAGDWEIVTSHINPTKWSYTSKPRSYLHILAQLCTPAFLSQRAFAACEFLIKEGNMVCRQAGAQLVVVSIPDPSQLSESGLELLASRSRDIKRFDPDFPDRQIGAICRKWGVPFVAAKEHVDIGDYKEDDVHWNKQGHQRVSKLLSSLYHDHWSEQKDVDVLKAVGTRTRLAPAIGPLRVHPANPRYFTDGSGRAIYLTGSHVHDNLVDRSTRPTFDYIAYLDFLQRHNHNFIRMWAWEHARVPQPNNTWLDFSPLPYQRTGPGDALDGKPKFDLTKFNQAYFDRLRARVIAARDRGIYVSVMLFEGWSVDGFDKNNSVFKAWDGHPFNINNNINGVDGDLDGDRRGGEVHTLRIPSITRLQAAYVRKVLDTLNDLDNVFYEIANECPRESTEWQYYMINFIHDYERNKLQQHPVVMTFLWDRAGNPTNGNNPELFASPAEAISPGRGPNNEYIDNPPAADGSKVVLSDTDHLWGYGGNSGWVWKSFLRGYNPIYMEADDPREHPEAEEVRRAMGYTRIYADKVDLAAMPPRCDLASTEYCLANPGIEYLIYLPSDPHWIECRVRAMRFFWRLEPLFRKFRELFRLTVIVDLSAASGRLAVEWLNPNTGNILSERTTTGGAKQRFRAPFRGDAVLYLAASKTALWR